MKRRAAGKKESGEYRTRLREMTAVLRRHEITRGITPKKLRMILEELGPTYIKFGQILSTRSDILPKKYCDELMHLCSEVAPMTFPEVEGAIRDSYGYSWREVFLEIEEEPLGSASIAQVHKAVLKSGEEVVIKVQRKGIYDIMEKDIALMRKAVKLIPPVSIKNMVDLDMVLGELWAVAQEELNFLTEAANLEEFSRKNAEIEFVAVPVLYRQYTTSRVLVMEYIDGFAVDDKAGLLENGYDLHEIGSKLVNNYMKQVMEDGFFHGDPHPGNVKIRGGKIVWLDMGMMGRLTERDRQLIGKAVKGIAVNDIGMIQDAVLQLGEFRGEPDQAKLHQDIRDFFAKYGTIDIGTIDIVKVMQDLMAIMKENRISMPYSLTMLARGLAHMEGVLADISPDINIAMIAAEHVRGNFFQKDNWKKTLKSDGKRLYQSVHKAIDIPILLADILQGYTKGQNRMHLDLHVSRDLAKLLARLIRNIVLGLWVMALLISSSIICTTDMTPKICGIPALGALGYLMAVVIMIYVFLRHIFSRK